MGRPQFMAYASGIGKTQTTGVRIEDERDDFAIDFARDSVWFCVQHFSFLCTVGPVSQGYDVRRATPAQHLQNGALRQDASRAKAKHMPMDESGIARGLAICTRPLHARPSGARKRRPRLIWRMPIQAECQSNGDSEATASERVERPDDESET